MSQNPFQPGQNERSPEEQEAFLKAIGALPEASPRESLISEAEQWLHVAGLSAMPATRK